MEVNKEYLSKNRDNDCAEILHRTQIAETTIIKGEHAVEYLVNFFEAVVVMRFLLELFAVSDNGFAKVIYTLSEPLVAPFRGAFATPSIVQGTVDPAALVSVMIIALIGWSVVGLIDLAGRPLHVPSLR